MDFGKVSPSELKNIDFSLPPDHPDTKKILSALKKKPDAKKKQKVYVGCAKWGRKEWLGKIYPLRTKEKDFVFHYVKQFNCIELNATHYRLPDESSIKKWKSEASPEFRFCPKFPQWISHIRRLKNCKDTTDRFIETIHSFGKNLGTSFLQMPPNFAPKSFPQLENYLRSLPNNLKVCVEFRHPGWYSDIEVSDQLHRMLTKLKIGTVITDTAGRRDLVHMRLSNSAAFVRFVGNSLHPTDYTRIDDWVKRLKKWLGSGLETLYFMMHMHDESDSPELITYAIRQMNKHCGLKIMEPVFYK